jgi:pimeloyl-ACP methyl ester carboxylesterase
VLAKLVVFMALGVGLAESVPSSPLAHWTHGDPGRETIVLIHGFNDSHETWQKIVPTLSKRYHVLLYDQPGHGDSPSHGTDYSPKRMALELKALLDSKGIKGAHIVGHSMGGRTALEFGAKFPELTKSVLVEDMSALSEPSSVKALSGALAKFEAVKQGVPDTFTGYFSAWFTLSRFYTTEEILWILASAKTLPDGSVKLGNRPEVTALYLHQGLSQDMTAQLKAISAPLQFFAADPNSGSAVLDGKGIAHLRSARPDVKIRVFKGSGHTVHDRPEYLEKLLQFLEQKEAMPHALIDESH